MTHTGESSPKSSTVAIATLSIGLLAISFAPIFIRFSETELGANGTVLNRMVVFLLAFGLWEMIRSRVALPLKETQEVDTITASQWLLLGCVGCFSVLSLVLWAMSLEYTTVAKSMLLNNLTPIFTSMLGWLILSQRFSGKFLIGMAIALSGAIGLGLEDLHSTDGFLIGDLYALLSAVFLGSYFLTVEQLRSRFSATTILLWRCGIGSGLLLPLTLLTEPRIVPNTILAIGAVLGLGLLSEGFGQRLIAASMDQLSSSFVALFLLLEPIISSVLAWIFFGEKISPVTGLGFAAILTGIIIAQGNTHQQPLEATQQPHG